MSTRQHDYVPRHDADFDHALAWQNERGNIGAWSEIQSAVIP